MFGYPWLNLSPVRVTVTLLDIQTADAFCAFSIDIQNEWICDEVTGMWLWCLLEFRTWTRILALGSVVQSLPELGCEYQDVQLPNLQCSCSLVSQLESFSLGLDSWFQASHKETPSNPVSSSRKQCWVFFKPNSNLTVLTRMSIPSRSTLGFAGCLCKCFSLWSSGPLVKNGCQGRSQLLVESVKGKAVLPS